MADAVTLDTITFSEYAQYTTNPVYKYTEVIADKDLRVAFTGIIVPDSCDPTTPGIAGDTSYIGDIVLRFNSPISSISFDAGCFNAARSTRIIIYGENGFKIEKVVNSFDNSAYEHFSFNYGENVIKKVKFTTIGDEPSGFAVDNVTISVRPESRKIVLANDTAIDSLLDKRAWNENTITFSFMKSGSEMPAYGDTIETFPTSKLRADTMSEFSAGQKAMTLQALDMWDDVADLVFQKVSDVKGAPGMMRFARADITAPADAFSPGESGESGDVFIGSARPTGQAVPGTYDYYVFIHEVGHALGLKHPHGTRGSGVVLPAAEDSHEFSIMSYRSYPGASVTGGVFQKPGSFPHTLMMNDIAAIQHIYGANFNKKSGNTTYHFDPTAAKIFETIWDGNGIDTYDASAYTEKVSISLGAGGWSVLGASQLALLNGDAANPIWARGSVFNAKQYKGDERSLIENAIGGSGNDKLKGNQIGNKLEGGSGKDILDGLGGDDRLYGGNGADKLYGGSAKDKLFGGDGADYLEGGLNADKLYGGKGNDRLVGGFGNDRLLGNAGQDILSGGDGADRFVFNEVSDSAAGLSRRDTISEFFSGSDKIVMDGIDADSGTSGHQAWSFIGTSAFSAAGQIRYTQNNGKTFVKADVDGDGATDFTIKIGMLVDLIASDFII